MNGIEPVTDARRSTNPASPSERLARVFDSRVATAELLGGADPALLFPRESTYCAGFARKRSIEFAGGRLCAHHALEQLGIHSEAILVNSDRSPHWPAGAIGSISHTGDFCGAAVARRSDFRGVGLDVEAIGRVTPDLDALIFTPPEREFLASVAPPDRAIAATVIFSAKEAFYKCQYAVTQTWLDFLDVSLEFSTDSPRDGTFRVAAAGGRAGTAANALLPLAGRYHINGGLAITGVTIPAAPAASSS